MRIWWRKGRLPGRQKNKHYQNPQGLSHHVDEGDNSGKGRDWMSSRISPACLFIVTPSPSSGRQHADSSWLSCTFLSDRFITIINLICFKCFFWLSQSPDRFISASSFSSFAHGFFLPTRGNMHYFNIWPAGHPPGKLAISARDERSSYQIQSDAKMLLQR